MTNKKLDDEFDILSDDEISQCTDIQNALELINKQNIITEIDPIVSKKFIVEKNKDIKELSTKKSLEEKTEFDLEEISNQADQAFSDLMDIAVNTVGKSCAEIANAAQSFLTVKLNAKMAKMESKYKKLNYELQLKKLEASTKKIADAPEIYEEDDGIQIIESNH